MSVSNGAAPKLSLKTPEPPRLLEWLEFRGAFSPPSSVGKAEVAGWSGSSKFVSSICPTLRDLLPRKFTDVLGSSSSDVSNNLLD